MRARRSSFTASVISVLLLLALPALVNAADQTAQPASPSALAMVQTGTDKAVPQGSWINLGHIELRFHVDVAAGSLTPQVEIQPSAAAFTGQPTFSGPALTASGTAVVPVTGLSDRQTYHWQARVVDTSGNASPWVPYSTATAPDLGIDEDAPSRPIISSVTVPNPARWYNARVVVMQWSAHDDLSGIQGYTLQLAHTPHVIPPGNITHGSGARISNLADGVWFLLLRAVDRAGNWSATATFRFQLDRQPARFRWLSPARVVLNPYFAGQTFRFTTTKDASVQLNLYRVGDRAQTAAFSFPYVRAGRVVSVTWNGKQRDGRSVQRGYYYFSAHAIDHAGNLTQVNLGGIYLHPDQGIRTPSGMVLYPDSGKTIIVSLSKQTLYAYDGTKLVLQTLVTTGNPALPTPPGNYTIMAKYSPFQFVSPWPPGSPYWYAPSWTQWAMLFRDGGYFLHDAPWRSVFGPGSNGPGQPGTNYGGTHGCVNIPTPAMSVLWNFSPIGTPVDVVP